MQDPNPSPREDLRNLGLIAGAGATAMLGTGLLVALGLAISSDPEPAGTDTVLRQVIEAEVVHPDVPRIYVRVVPSAPSFVRFVPSPPVPAAVHLVPEPAPEPVEPH